MTPKLIKSFQASNADVTGRRIVAFDGNGGLVDAALNTDAIIGVSDELGGKADEMTDVILVGIADVTAGGDIDAGDPLTTDADGKAIKAVPTAGVEMRAVGFALLDASDGDFFPVLLQPHVIAPLA